LQTITPQTVHLFDNLGKYINSYEVQNKTEIGISHLNKGTYWLNVGNETHLITKE